ncbi:hypothetical protein V3C99_000568 [Haemonchus contortus]
MYSYPMKGQFRQDLLDEVDALASSIGEEYVTIEEGNKELHGTISVVLDPSPKPILFSAKEGKDYRQFESVQLPPLKFTFFLPADYPCEKPKIDVESIWMPNAMKEKLLCRLDDVSRANIGFPMLFLCYDAIKKFVAEMGTFEVRLDSGEFPMNHNFSAIEMLKLLREESEKAEMNAFLAQCHDCEVCFENKPGLQCVRFFPCGHSFCKDCVRAFFKEKLTSQKVSPLTCLADSCESSASQKTIVELLGQKEFDRYEGILLKKALERMDDMVTCPRISCQKPSAVSETTEYLATCLVCGYNFCTACYRGYHGVQSCFGSWGLREVSLDEYLLASQEDRIKMAEYYGGIEKLEAEMEKNFKKADASTYAWIHGHSKRCPQCHIPIQRQSGCNILLCSMCDTRFCFNCDAILGKKNYVDHFMDSPKCGGSGLQIPLGD